MLIWGTQLLKKIMSGLHMPTLIHSWKGSSEMWQNKNQLYKQSKKKPKLGLNFVKFWYLFLTYKSDSWIAAMMKCGGNFATLFRDTTRIVPRKIGPITYLNATFRAISHFWFQFYVKMGKLNNGGGGLEWRFLGPKLKSRYASPVLGCSREAAVAVTQISEV